MEQKTLSAVERKERAKGANRRLRIAGKIPAVVYGHAGTAAVAVDEHEFSQKFKRISENTIISLSVDGKSHEVLLKDFQEDTLTGKIIHIDFYEVEKDRMLRTNVPVRLLGTAAGVREGAFSIRGFTGSRSSVFRRTFRSRLRSTFRHSWSATRFTCGISPCPRGFVFSTVRNR